MIRMDIMIPENCMVCPCSYFVRTGKYADKLICRAIEREQIRDGDRDKLIPEKFVVNNFTKRMDNCPMKEVEE